MLAVLGDATERPAFVHCQLVEGLCRERNPTILWWFQGLHEQRWHDLVPEAFPSFWPACKDLCRLLGPCTGTSDAQPEASPGTGAKKRPAVESPRFSVLRAHLQGLVLRKPEQVASSGARGSGASAWRPMQSSAPCSQRPLGAGASQVH